jgi:hypothetical protein
MHVNAEVKGECNTEKKHRDIFNKLLRERSVKTQEVKHFHHILLEEFARVIIIKKTQSKEGHGALRKQIGQGKMVRTRALSHSKFVKVKSTGRAHQSLEKSNFLGDSLQESCYQGGGFQGPKTKFQTFHHIFYYKIIHPKFTTLYNRIKLHFNLKLNEFHLSLGLP